MCSISFLSLSTSPFDSAFVHVPISPPTPRAASESG